MDRAMSELERLIRMQVELEHVQTEMALIKTNINNLSEDVESVGEKIDSKFDWIIKLLGATLVSVVVGLGLIVVQDKHISVVDTVSISKTKQR